MDLSCGVYSVTLLAIEEACTDGGQHTQLRARQTGRVAFVHLERDADM